MKLLIKNDRVVATALDDYTGDMTAIEAPADFDASALERYQVVDGQVQLIVPQSVSRLQARLALIAADLWTQVVDYFELDERTAIEQAFWEDAQIWRRDNAALIAAAVALGLDDAALDQLFTDAAAL